MTYYEAVDAIMNIPKFGISGGNNRCKSGNENLRKVMALLDNPQDKIKAIHIAGTNGKGSTATFTSCILRNLGLSVGLFTSPHLVKINERIKINDEDISDDDFLSCYNEVSSAVKENEKDGGITLSFFEYLFAIAAVYYAKKSVDIVVYETGLGGRLDATNIVNPVVTAITSIGLDHTKYLGDTIEEIASEKAGIIKNGVPVVINTANAIADEVIEKIAAERNAKMINVANLDYMINEFADNGIDFSISNSYYMYQDLILSETNAVYQVDNAVTAILLCNEYVRVTVTEDRKKAYFFGDKISNAFNIDNSEAWVDIDALIERKIIQRALDEFYWPGRMEEIEPGIIVDGAHNLDAIERFTQSVLNQVSDGKMDLLFAVAEDKDYEPMIEYLCKNLSFGRVCVTTLNSSRGISANYISKIFMYHLQDKCEIIAEENIETALRMSADKAKEEKHTLYCVGSLYLVGSIKELWR